ncbi:DHHC palmitoyltransferase-domain-containing protein [Roridomyces roridus]|uniref:Palmitoyltransferase n=1 Tax=Roridomyces roridus TaxID=1738132 RepID=A0AAD7C7I7_9AGAR|nr:DHHC palmitoyltransferase-domain-containing protein [Roridomyces roridus]
MVGYVLILPRVRVVGRSSLTLFTVVQLTTLEIFRSVTSGYNNNKQPTQPPCTCLRHAITAPDDPSRPSSALRRHLHPTRSNAFFNPRSQGTRWRVTSMCTGTKTPRGTRLESICSKQARRRTWTPARSSGTSNVSLTLTIGVGPTRRGVVVVWARKPLRSKHCRVCDKCVARSDHHCPWVWNYVGANNHRQSVVFVTALVFGLILFDYLTYAFFSSVVLPIESDPSAPTPSASCPLPSSLCILTATDTFLLAVAVWATLQLSWTSVLLASQFWHDCETDDDVGGVESGTGWVHGWTWGSESGGADGTPACWTFACSRFGDT